MTVVLSLESDRYWTVELSAHRIEIRQDCPVRLGKWMMAGARQWEPRLVARDATPAGAMALARKVAAMQSVHAPTFLEHLYWEEACQALSDESTATA